MSEVQNNITNQTLADQLPEPQDLLMKVPLYEVFQVDESCFSKLYGTQYFDENIDWYCIECNRPTIFEGDNNDTNTYAHSNSGYMLSERLFLVSLVCQRDRNHKILFIFKVFNNKLTKIGQYPSIADLYSGEIEKYRKILGKEKYKEIARAVGLVSHGVGIGAFVYLRRIFEDLIDEAHQEAQKSSGWDEEQYSRSRMDEKILLLQNHLPSFLVENRGLYSILSVGIHYLTERDCLEYFDSVKVGIELILDEKIEQERRRTKLESAKQAIADIKRKLGHS